MSIKFKAMNLREQIEYLLAEEYGAYSDEMVDKLLNLHSVSNCDDNSDEEEWSCPDHKPYRGPCSTCGCY